MEEPKDIINIHFFNKNVKFHPQGVKIALLSNIYLIY